MEFSEEQIHNLIKGRIGEVFAECILKESGYTILPYGYEHYLGYLANKVPESKNIREILAVTRMTPDFIVLSNKNDNCFFIEAKFRKNLDIGRFIEEQVKPIDEFWKKVHFFVMTSKPPYFYYDFVNTILKNRSIRALKDWGHEIGISKAVIEKYERIAEKVMHFY